MKVVINFEKKHAYFLLFGLGVIFLFGFVMAYNTAFTGSTGNPVLMGHSADEVMVKVPKSTDANPTEKTLQAAIDAGDMGAWIRNGTNISYNVGNVGIGTVDPTTKFRVSGGDIGLDADGLLRSVAGDTQAASIELRDLTSGNMVITPSNAGGTQRNVVIPAGNLGVSGNVWTTAVCNNGGNNCLNPDAVVGRQRVAAVGCGAGWASSCDANSDGWPDNAGSANTVDWSGVGGVTIYYCVDFRWPAVGYDRTRINGNDAQFCTDSFGSCSGTWIKMGSSANVYEYGAANQENGLVICNSYGGSGMDVRGLTNPNGAFIRMGIFSSPQTTGISSV